MSRTENGMIHPNLPRGPDPADLRRYTSSAQDNRRSVLSWTLLKQLVLYILLTPTQLAGMQSNTSHGADDYWLRCKESLIDAIFAFTKACEDPQILRLYLSSLGRSGIDEGFLNSLCTDLHKDVRHIHQLGTLLNINQTATILVHEDAVLPQPARYPVPGPLDLSSSNRAPVPVLPPSVLCAPRIVEDLESTGYPSRVKISTPYGVAVDLTKIVSPFVHKYQFGTTAPVKTREEIKNVHRRTASASVRLETKIEEEVETLPVGEQENGKSLTVEAERDADEAKSELPLLSPYPAPSLTLPPSTKSLPAKPPNDALASSAPTAERSRRPFPARFDLSFTNKKPLLPSALASVRIIENLESISYPHGVSPPVKEFNINAEKGKFRYDRNFLLQFAELCKDKPGSLAPLEAIGIAPKDGVLGSGSGRQQNRRSTSSMGSPDGRGIPVGFGLPPFGGRTSRELWAMAQLPTARNSVHRSASPQAARNTSVSGGPFGPGVVSLGSPAQWTRAAAQGQAGEISASHNSATAAAAEQDDPTTIERKVKILLNKLTERRFDSISDQIIQWANLSEKETDGKTLTQVVNLVFEKAINDVTSSEMYARLCRKMMEQISPDVQDEGITNAEGHPIAGGQPFRKYLLNLCQEHFEKGWLARGVAAAAVAEDKILDDKAKKDAAEGKAPQEVLHSQEYYKAQKIKRQGLGLVKFIAELFKLQILTERIMHECIKKLLLNIDDPEEGEIESLCWLLVTVGRALDTSKARNHMDVYFIRMNDLAQNESINPRIQQMLQDVIELRQRYWVPRNAQAAPTTLAQVHQAGVPRAPPKAGDPSHFGKINKSSQPATFGPTSIFSKKDVKGCDTPTNSLPRTASSSNMFSMPSGNFAEPVDESVHPTRTTSRSPTRKNGVDFAQGGLIEVSGGRKKVNLLPRIFPVEAVEKVEEENGTHSDSEIDSPVPGPSMTEDEVKTKIAEDAKELWNVRNLNDAESYFVALPSEHRHLLVNELVTKALESKEDDVKLVSDVFSRVAESSACSPSSFEEGFAPSLEFLDDIAIDSPQAYIVTARLLCASRLSHKAVDSLAGNINTDGNPSVPPRHRLLQQYHQLA